MGNFKFPDEFECKCGCGQCDIDWRVWFVCQQIRQRFNAPVVVRSGYRCEAHNQNVGGAPKSDHRFGWAADVAVLGKESSRVALFVESLPEVMRIGIYEPGGLNGENGFIHFGVRDRGLGTWKFWRVSPQGSILESR